MYRYSFFKNTSMNHGADLINKLPVNLISFYIYTVLSKTIKVKYILCQSTMFHACQRKYTFSSVIFGRSLTLMMYDENRKEFLLANLDICYIVCPEQVFHSTTL